LAAECHIDEDIAFTTRWTSSALKGVRFSM
jgi:hypothetical protein